MRKLYFVNRQERRLADASGQAARVPSVRAGERLRFAVRALDNLGSGLVATELEPMAWQVSLGYRDKMPMAGKFALVVNGDATVSLDWNAPTDKWEEALNAAGSIDDFLCSELPGGGFTVRRAGGEAVTVTAGETTLKPDSVVRIEPIETDALGWEYEVWPTVAPLAFNDSVERVLPPAPTISTVQDGGTDPSGVFEWNEIQALYLPPDFRGTYQFRRGYEKSGLLDRFDGLDRIKEVLDAMLAPEGASVKVTLPVDNTAHIEFLDDLGGKNLDSLEVHVHSAPEGDWTLDLDLDEVAIYRALRAAGGKLSLALEVFVWERIDPEDVDSDVRRTLLFSETIEVLAPVGWDGLAREQNIDWMRPRPRDYTPFTLSQLLVGQQQAYSAVIGDGAAAEFVIDHNLASELCSVMVRENVGGGRLLRPDEYAVVFDSTNSLTLTIGSYGVPGVDELVAFVIAIGPESAFQAHTNTVPQVVAGGGYPALPDFMDDIGSRVTVLESVLPSVGVAATASQASGIEIELPETQEILFFKGVTKDAWGEDGPDASKLGRAPMMLPAVHDATVTSYTTGDLPAIAADSVWSNDSSGVLEMGRGIYGGRVLVSGFFASDGRVRYAARRDATTTSYFPAGFDRELWRIFINDKMLRVNRTLDVQWGLALQLVGASSNAQWVLVVEKGTAPSQATPATTGTNLENVAWDATPILSQRIILTGNRQTHSFGVRIKRSLVSLVDTLTMDTMLYGVWEGNNAAAPAGANFALRARLINFDTENALAADARGWVTYEVIGPAGGEEEEEKPKATIS